MLNIAYCISLGAYSIYMMTPMAQQSTGLPYLCLSTTSGAESKNTFKTFSWYFVACVSKDLFLFYGNLVSLTYQDILESRMDP